MTYLPHILAGVASFAAVLFAIMLKTQRDDADNLADELTTSAELDRLQRAKIEKLKSDADLFTSQKNNAIVRAAQLEREIERLKETIADLKRKVPVRNAKGQYTRKSITPIK